MKKLRFSHLLEDLGGMTKPRSLKETAVKKYVPKANGSVNVYIVTPWIPPPKPSKEKIVQIPKDPDNYVTGLKGKWVSVKWSYTAWGEWSKWYSDVRYDECWWAGDALVSIGFKKREDVTPNHTVPKDFKVKSSPSP